VCGGLAGPAWGSLMSDYVPAKKRGRYFGWRNRTVGAVTVGSIVASGLLLNFFQEISYGTGFWIIFSLAAAARYVSAYFISRMDEPPHKKDPASDFTFLMFLRRFRESNFLKFVVFSSCLTFATYMAAPFFAVFMLRDLQLSYVTYMALQVGSSLASLIALPLWGKHADLVGNVRVLRLSSFLAALIPMFWLLSHNPAYLMLVQILAGFSWSGVTLSAGNFIYDAVTPQKRVRCIAYFNVICPGRLFCITVAAAFRLSPARSVCALLLLPDFLLPAALAEFPRGQSRPRGFHPGAFFQRCRYSSARRPGAGLTIYFYRLDKDLSPITDWKFWERCKIRKSDPKVPDPTNRIPPQF